MRFLGFSWNLTTWVTIIIRVSHNGMHYCKATTHKLLYILYLPISVLLLIPTQRETLNAQNIIKHTACIRLLVGTALSVYTISYCHSSTSF